MDFWRPASGVNLNLMHEGAPKHEPGSGHPPLLRRLWYWRLIAAFALAALVLGPIGSWQMQKSIEGTASVFTAFYETLQLFALHSPHYDKPVNLAMHFARWLGAGSMILTVIEFAGHALREEIAAVRLSRVNGHVIICGLGRKGLAVARCLRRHKRLVVLVDRSPQPDMVEACRELGALVITGDATNPDVLNHARIEQAATLIAVCPDDGTNCETAALACRLRAQSKPGVPLLCQVQLTDTDYRSKLQEAMAHRRDAGRVTLQFFDVFDPEARHVVIRDLPLDHDGIGPAETRSAHLVIIGFGRMGRALAVRAAQLGHFANGRRLRITVIDRLAEKHRAELLFRFPRIASVCDLDFHTLEAVSPDARNLMEKCCQDPACITSVVVCFDNEQRGLEIAVQLLPLLKLHDTRLAVRMSRQSGLVHLLAEAGSESDLHVHIRPFGMEERACLLEHLGADSNETFVRSIHAAYVRMRLDEERQKSGADTTPLDDPALRNWDDLTEDLRESNRQQFDHLHIKLRTAGLEAAEKTDPRPAVAKFTDEQVEMLSQLEHRRWVAERLLSNWTYAEKKNIDRRENPNVVDWNQLSEKVKDYDRQAVRMIPILLARADKKMVSRKTLP